MTSSPFKPVSDPFLYQIISNDVNIIPKSPINHLDFYKPNHSTHQKYKKKRWEPYLKERAVEKAKEIGLTHATNQLQQLYPDLYSELCPSTLQYWVQKAYPKKKKIIQ
ncbi:Uncharacterized protein QTN25_004375 [Entamoeba marina]